MKAVVAFIVLFVVAVMVLAIVGLLLRAAVQRWRAVHAPWEMDEESDGEGVRVLAVREGEESLLIGYVPFAALDFDARLYEVRAEGRSKVFALNCEDS